MTDLPDGLTQALVSFEWRPGMIPTSEEGKPLGDVIICFGKHASRDDLKTFIIEALEGKGYIDLSDWETKDDATLTNVRITMLGDGPDALEDLSPETTEVWIYVESVMTPPEHPEHLRRR